MAHAEQQQQTYFKRLSAPAKTALSLRESFSIEEFAFIWAGFEPYSGGYSSATERQAVRDQYLREIKLYEKVLSEQLSKEEFMDRDPGTDDLLKGCFYSFYGVDSVPEIHFGDIPNPIRDVQFPVDAYRRFFNDKGQKFPLDSAKEPEDWEVNGIARRDLQEIVQKLPKVGCILRGLVDAMSDDRGVDIDLDDLVPGDLARAKDSEMPLGRSVPLTLIELRMRNAGLTRPGKDGKQNQTVLTSIHMAVFPERAPGPRTTGKE